jgi:non-ribosomal peptide synthetase component F
MGDKVAQLASISFDICVSEIFNTLVVGGTLILRVERDYFEAVRKANIVITTPTSLLKMDPKDYPNLKIVVAAGENLQQSIVDKWTPFVNLKNAYGPSETTCGCTTGDLTTGKAVTIGKPLPNTLHYIVDKHMQLVPIGVAGELVIGGPGVALGYLNRPDLTKEKFVPNHFLKDGTTMYRTGDVCKWNEEGEIQIMGRMDDMVKVKGYRIELDEVAAALQRHPSVTAATVLVKEDQLVGYVTPMVDTTVVRDFITAILPYYMIPSVIIALLEFPMTSNGKVNL